MTSRISFLLIFLFCSSSILLSQNECSDETTFSTFIDKNDSSTSANYLMNGIAASNGEFVSIGYKLELGNTNIESDLIFIRQNEFGDVIETPIKTSIRSNGIVPVWGEGEFRRDAFIEEAFDSGISLGYYIATTVAILDGNTSGSPFNVILLMVNHSGEVQWVEMLEGGTKEYARGLTTSSTGNPIVLLDYSDDDGLNGHLAFWQYDQASGRCDFITSDIAGDPDVLFKPTAITKSSDGLNYAVCGVFQEKTAKFPALYLLDQTLSPTGFFSYDLDPLTKGWDATPSTVIFTDGRNPQVIMGGYYEEGGIPRSFAMQVIPSPRAANPGEVVWANAFYDDQSGVSFGNGIILTDGLLDNEEPVLVGQRGIYGVDFPFYMELDKDGKLKKILHYYETDSQTDFGNIEVMTGIESNRNDGFFMHSSAVNQVSETSRIWTSNTDSNGELKDCDCWLETDIDVSAIAPFHTVRRFTPPIANGCIPAKEPFNSTPEPLVFSSCDKKDDPLCEESYCLTDTFLLNTGYDHTEGDVFEYTELDAFWELTTSPLANGINLPRPAFVVDPNNAWIHPSETQWISAYPQSAFEINNPEPDIPYTLRACFCVCDDSTSLDLSLKAYSDDIVKINLVTEAGAHLAFLTETFPEGFRPSSVPGSVDMTMILNKGTYCIAAEQRNLHQVAMGLNIKGYITGASLINPICCGNTNGTIVGTKYHDRNCNGSRENANSPGSADHEEGVPGFPIILCENGVTIAETTTDDLGYYVFNDVPPGDYSVKEGTLDNWEAVDPNDVLIGIDVSVDTAEVVGEIDFGNKYTGPIEMDSDFSCVVPGEDISIRWIGGRCDCDVQIFHRGCDGGQMNLITSLTNNTGGYNWEVPQNFPSGSHEIVLVACDGTETVVSNCFVVQDIDLAYDFEYKPCGFTAFTANSTPSGSYSWNFGDLTTGSGSSVQHSYLNQGPFTVRLSVTTMEGCRKTVTFTVNPLVDNMPPGISCPPNFMVDDGELYGTDIAGIATANDDCDNDILIEHSDELIGSCPGNKTIIRTWKATDDFGNMTSCNQVITLKCDTTYQTPDFFKLFGDSLNGAIVKMEYFQGSIYALGIRGSTDPEYQGFLMKINFNGTIDWSAQIPKSYVMNDFAISNTGFILVGDNRPESFGTSNSALVKINHDGSFGWARSYDFSNRERLLRIAPANLISNPALPSMEEFLVLGYVGQGDDDQILLKIDEDGTEIFRKEYDGNRDDQAHGAFKRLNNGSYLLAGRIGSTGQLGYMDGEGNNALLDEEGGLGTRLLDIAEANNQVYVVGTDNSVGFILAFDQTGKKRVAKYYFNEVERFNRIRHDDSGNLYLAAKADIGDGNADRNLIYKLNESQNSMGESILTIEWVKYLDHGLTTFGGANLLVVEDKLVLQENLPNHPDGYGLNDDFIGVFDLDMTNDCVIELTNHTMSGEIVTNEITDTYTVTGLDFPDLTPLNLVDPFLFDCKDFACDQGCDFDIEIIAEHIECNEYSLTANIIGTATNPTIAWLSSNRFTTFTNSDEITTQVNNPISGTYEVCVEISTGPDCKKSICRTLGPIDNEPPRLFCLQPIPPFVTDPMECTTIINISVDATDNCTAPTITCERSDGLPCSNIFPKGATTVMYTATDRAGNTDKCEITVNVEDNENPTAICNQNLQVLLDPMTCEATISPDMIDAGSTDNCEIVERTVNPTSIMDGCGQYQVALIITDCGGNTNNCISNVTVSDAASPTFTFCPPDITISEDQNATPSITGTAIAIDNCGIGLLNYSDNATTNCPQTPNVIERTWFASDDCGNVSECEQVIIQECIDTSCVDISNANNWNDYQVANWDITSEPGFPVVVTAFDGARRSILTNDIDFGGNWLDKYEDKCLCFDYKANLGGVPADPTVNFAPRIRIYQGTIQDADNWEVNAIMAEFQFYGQFTGEDVWQNWCLPISLSQNGDLPSNSFGEWVFDPTSVNPPNPGLFWDSFIQDVTGLILLVDYHSTTSERVFFANFCASDCPTSKCDSISIASIPSTIPNDTCCFNLELSNLIDSCFFRVDFENQSGITWNLSTGSDWDVVNFSGYNFGIIPDGFGYIDEGNYPQFAKVCLSDLDNNPIQTIEVTYLASSNGTSIDTTCVEILEFDCTEFAKPLCVSVVQDSVFCDGSEITYCLSIFNNPNNLSFPVDTIKLIPAPNTGQNFAPICINIDPDLAPGQTSGLHYVNLPIDMQGDTLCYQIIAKGDNDCCTDTSTYKIYLPICDPCINTDIQVVANDCDTCCWDISLINNYEPDYFRGVEIKTITPGLNLGRIKNDNTPLSGWIHFDLNPFNNSHVYFEHTNGTIFANSQPLQLGTTTLPTVCLNGYDQPFQQIEIGWKAGNEIVCLDTLEFNCTPPDTTMCARLFNDTIYCASNGNYVFEFQVENLSNHPINLVELQDFMPSGSYDPLYLSSNIPAGGTSGTLSVTLPSTLAQGTLLSFDLTIHEESTSGDDLLHKNCCTSNVRYEVQIPDCNPNCTCGTYSNISIKHDDDNFTLRCGDEFIAKCREEVVFSYSYECPDNCPMTIGGFVTTPSGETLDIPILGGLGRPFTGVVPADMIQDEGLYVVSLNNHCGSETCSCSFSFTVRTCPDADCVCPIDSDLVNSEIEWSRNYRLCTYSFTHPALVKCDQVKWSIYQGDMLVSDELLAGNVPFSVSLDHNLKYTVRMVVTRRLADGTACSFVKAYKLKAKCRWLPVSGPIECIDPKPLNNPSFLSSTGWSVLSGERDKIFKQEMGYDSIGGYASLSGNRARTDVIQQNIDFGTNPDEDYLLSFAIKLDSFVWDNAEFIIESNASMDPEVIAKIDLADMPRNEWIALSQAIHARTMFRAFRMYVTNPTSDAVFETTIGVDAFCIDSAPTECCFAETPFRESVQEGFTPTHPDPFTVRVASPEFDDCHTITWDWGDGTDTTLIGTNTVSHTYTISGRYTICMTVAESDGGDVCWEDRFCVEDIPVSTNEAEILRGLSVYPNPTSDDLFFERKTNLESELQVNVFDINGKVIANHRFKKGEFKSQISLSNHAQGLYIIEFKDLQGNVGYKRIVKQ